MYKTPYTYDRIVEAGEASHLRHERIVATATAAIAKRSTNNATRVGDADEVPPESHQYGIELTQVDRVWELAKSKFNAKRYPGGETVKVCIVDTGYDAGHEDLPPRENVTGTDAGYGDPLRDVDGHGTHCAGVIGALGSNGRGIVGGECDCNDLAEREERLDNTDPCFAVSQLQILLLLPLLLLQSTPTPQRSRSTYPSR